MPVRKATKTANINANLYDGEFQLGFDCVGVENCRFALCPLMPPTGDEDCTYREHGSCRDTSAQQAALEALKKRIVKELKQREDDSI
jgi:hypothetical protein